MHVYKVVMTRKRKLGLREWEEKKTVPMATRQRVACILNYQYELSEEDRWDLHITRAKVDDTWEPVEFSIPSSSAYHDYSHRRSDRPKVYLEKEGAKGSPNDALTQVSRSAKPYPFGEPGTCLLGCTKDECSPEIHERYDNLERRYQEGQVTVRHGMPYPNGHQQVPQPDYCLLCRRDQEDGING